MTGVKPVDASIRPARSVFWLCARQELRLSVRSKWVQMFASVFSVLATAVAASGYVLSGGSGVQDFSRTAASLLQLVLLLVPLTSLVFGVIGLTPEPGTAELLFSQPAERRTIVAGQLGGMAAALVASEAVGFGASGVLLFAQVGDAGLSSFLSVVGAAIALTVVFLSIAAAIAAGDTSHARARGFALAIVIWFTAVLLYDVVALGVASMLPSGMASRMLIAAAIANPVDAVRTGALFMAEGSTAFGAASLAFFRVTGGGAAAALWLAGSVTVWTVVPLAAAVARLRRVDV